jgi:hypothetical protein
MAKAKQQNSNPFINSVIDDRVSDTTQNTNVAQTSTSLPLLTPIRSDIFDRPLSGRPAKTLTEVTHSKSGVHVRILSSSSIFTGDPLTDESTQQSYNPWGEAIYKSTANTTNTNVHSELNPFISSNDNRQLLQLLSLLSTIQ